MKTELDKKEKLSTEHKAPPISNVLLAAGICRHTKHQIAEREFYVNQKHPYSGTRIICKKCGKNKFIKDAVRSTISAAKHDK